MDECHLYAIAVLLCNEVLNHLVQITCYDDELGYAVLYQRIHRTLQKTTLTNLQQALRSIICQRTKA